MHGVLKHEARPVPDSDVDEREPGDSVLDTRRSQNRDLTLTRRGKTTLYRRRQLSGAAVQRPFTMPRISREKCVVFYWFLLSFFSSTLFSSTFDTYIHFGPAGFRAIPSAGVTGFWF